MYNNYEEYMQSILGYNDPNTYRETENYYYNNMDVNTNMQEIDNLYPEIYGIVYPIIQKMCSRRNFSNINENTINEMVEEVYGVIEPGDDIVETEAPLKNGDVRNPRAKETRQHHRNNNSLLKDLIRILILRELWQGGRPHFPPRPGGMPPRPGMHGMGPIPPIIKPRKSKNVLAGE